MLFSRIFNYHLYSVDNGFLHIHEIIKIKLMEVPHVQTHHTGRMGNNH